MSKRSNRKVFGILCVFIVVWGAIFVTDYVRCSSLREPLFVISRGVSADDGGSGTYQGLGYQVEVEKFIDAEYGPCVRSVEMSVFGKVISASIS